jgi:hypothetical protein
MKVVSIYASEKTEAHQSFELHLNIKKIIKKYNKRCSLKCFGSTSYLEKLKETRDSTSYGNCTSKMVNSLAILVLAMQ